MAEKRDWKAIGCAALVGALIAFPAGVMVTRRGEGGEPPQPSRNPPRGTATSRDFYSPNVVSDPYVLEQQRRVVEALERSCRDLGENCAEARQARQRVEEAARD